MCILAKLVRDQNFNVVFVHARPRSKRGRGQGFCDDRKALQRSEQESKMSKIDQGWKTILTCSPFSKTNWYLRARICTLRTELYNNHTKPLIKSDFFIFDVVDDVYFNLVVKCN